MAKIEAKPALAAVKAHFTRNPDGLRDIVRAILQEVLEAEMTQAVGAARSERGKDRLGDLSSSQGRPLVTPVSKLELRIPQYRDGRFSTEPFERYQPSERRR